MIGADGLHSVVLKLVFGPEGRFERPLGVFAAAFGIADYGPRDPGGRRELCGSRAAIWPGIPCGMGGRCSLRYSPGIWRGRAPKDVDAQKEAVRKVFAKDGWECPEILEAIETCTDFYFDDVSQIRMDSDGGRADASDWSATAASAPRCWPERARRSRWPAPTSSPASPRRPTATIARPSHNMKRCFTPSWQRSNKRPSGSRPVSSHGRASGLSPAILSPERCRSRVVSHLALGRLLVDRLELPDY